MYGKIKEHLQNELKNIEEAGLYKKERIIVTPQSAKIKVETGQEVLNFCANNYLAYGCVSAIKDQGLRIPDDIGILTFDDYPFSKLLEPNLTVVNIDVYDLGYEAGKNILKIIRKPNVHIQSYITYPSIIQRESTLHKVR